MRSVSSPPEKIRYVVDDVTVTFICRYTWRASIQRWQFCAGCMRHDSTLAAPSPDNSAKEYPEKIRGIVDEISKLTLLEVSDLNELLKVLKTNCVVWVNYSF